MFSSNCQAKQLGHVKIFVFHPIRVSPIKMVEQHCERNFNIDQAEQHAGTYSPSAAKRDVLEVCPFEVDRAIEKPLWHETLGFGPISRVSSIAHALIMTLVFAGTS